MKGPKGDIKSYDKYPNWAAFQYAMDVCIKQRVALDIGAHIGTMAIPLSHYFNRVEAFEPMYWKYLMENVSDNVFVHPLGAGNANKQETLWTCPYQSGSSSILQHPDNPYSKNAIPQTIEIVPVDNFGFTNVDFVKIDVEGYEFLAVEGMSETLKENNPVIMIEYLRKWQPKEYTYDMCHSLLEELGYTRIAQFKDDHIYRKN